ncbi:hypothetical protein ACPV3S_14545 [Photobacterium damselae]|uniref:hypothetical protein n=1 Tax=Photobacterium damselae TaxID=38293 RepID=UPI004067F65E
MSHVTSVIGTGQGVDPDTNEKIRIPDPLFLIETWDDRLKNALERANSKRGFIIAFF